ncbi:hypothetical protein B0H11DRAFT_2260437 [Mycena galericulata]|nr:hypothetical protein B0H11DRAFT_2260437 [Mycena galericulata]
MFASSKHKSEDLRPLSRTRIPCVFGSPISQLIGVLHYHNIVCTPPPHTSLNSLAFLNAEIKPKALHLKEERLKVVIASAEGIIDGHTVSLSRLRSPKRRRSPGKSAVAGLSRKAGTAKPGKVKLTRELGQNVVEHDEQMEQV